MTFWEHNKLSDAVRLFDDPEVLLCHHEAYLIRSNGTRFGIAQIYPVAEKAMPLSLFPMKNPYGFSILFRRDLLGFSDLWKYSVDDFENGSRMAHDQWFFFLASVFGTTAYIDKPLASYRQHGKNTYGMDLSQPSFWQRAGRWLNRAATENAGFGIAANARTQILEDLRERLDCRWRARAEEGIASYKAFAQRCSLRSSVYGTPKISGRLAAWFAMIRTGAYDKNVRWSIGRGAMAVDLICLLVPKPLKEAGLKIWRVRLRQAQRQRLEEEQQRVIDDRAFGERRG